MCERQWREPWVNRIQKTSESEERRRKVSETCRDQKGHIRGCLWKWSLVGLYAEFLTVLDTKPCVVTLSRGGLGGGEEGRRRGGGGDCLQSENILFLLPTHQHKSGLAQLTGWSWRPSPFLRALHQTQVVCCGPVAVTSGSVKAPQL